MTWKEILKNNIPFDDNGLFYFLFQNSLSSRRKRCPELAEFAECFSSLDYVYFVNRIFNKTVSSLVEFYYNVSGDFTQLMEDLTGEIQNVYFYKWNKLAKNFLQEYDVLKPYNVNESEDINMSYDSNKTTNSKITTTNSGRTDDSVYGFNSSEAKGTTLSADENSNVVQGSSDDNYETDNKTEMGNKDRLKTGNLGNHSFAELINKDIELWKNNFIEIIFKDVDKLLTCPLYSY